MVWGVSVNNSIVTLINQHGGRAIGLTCKDGHLLRARKLFMQKTLEDGTVKQIDLGQVGEVVGVKTDVLEMFSASDVIPVKAIPITTMPIWWQVKLQKHSVLKNLFY